MKRHDIQYAENRPKRLRLYGSDAFVLYLPGFLTMGIAGGLMVYNLLQPGRIAESLAVIAAVLSLLHFWSATGTLNLTPMVMNVSMSQTRERILEGGASAGWELVRSDDDLLIFHTVRPSRWGSGSTFDERVTVLFHGNSIWCNSIKDLGDVMNAFLRERTERHRENVEWIFMVAREGVWTYGKKQGVARNRQLVEWNGKSSERGDLLVEIGGTYFVPIIPPEGFDPLLYLLPYWSTVRLLETSRNHGEKSREAMAAWNLVLRGIRRPEEIGMKRIKLIGNDRYTADQLVSWILSEGWTVINRRPGLIEASRLKEDLSLEYLTVLMDEVNAYIGKQEGRLERAA